MLAALAWRNLWRRPQRTLLSVLSIALVCSLLVFALSFQEGVYAQMRQTTLRIFDGYAQLQPAGYADDPTLERAVADPDRLVRQAESIAGVTVAAPRVNAFAILARGDRSYAASVIGVDPVREPQVSTLASRIIAGRYLQASDSDAAILGDVLARNLGVKVGDRVSLLGSGRDGSVAADVLTAAGLYHSGILALDRSILEMPLARAQDTFGMQGEASILALAGPSLDAVDRALPRLSALARRDGIVVRDWQALQPALYETIQVKYAMSLVFYATLVLVVAFIILNTLLMSVLERTRELGTLLALGMRSAQIGAMVVSELLMLAAVGVLIGVSAGAAVTLWLQHTGIVFSLDPRLLMQLGVPRRLMPSLSWFSALAGPAALLAAIVLGGLVPYVRVHHMTPAIAMRAA